MPRRAARGRARGKSRRSRRGAAGSIMPVYPGLHGPGFSAGVIGRWLARPSRLGLSRALVGVAALTLLLWIVVGLSLIGS
jgi:hypothetical protein